MSFCAIALSFDANTRTCDVVVGANGQVAMDFTPATPMLISIGSDRRALPDDTLPYDAGGSPLPFNARRGWVLDALDTGGRLIGSRLWLLHREKRSEDTRRRAKAYAAEGTEWIEVDYGVPVEVDAAWPADTVLGIVARVDRVAIPIPRAA